MNKLNLKYVNEVIGEEYKNWKKGDVVKIQAQTGTGKTWFVTGGVKKDGSIEKGLIGELPNSKFLYVCNRIELKRQLKKDLLTKNNLEIPKEVEELDKINTIENITIVSYQTLTEITLNNIYKIENMEIDKFDYIILDECHFFLTDAAFNNKTEAICNELINRYYTHSVRVFMSATMGEIDTFINKKTEEKFNEAKEWIAFGDFKSNKIWEYTTGKDYSYLNINYFKNKKDICTFIKNKIIEKDEKWIVFVKSIVEGKEYVKILKELNVECNFIYANSKDTERVNIRDKSDFNTKVLITTKVLDNGINLKAEDLKNIIINAYDKTTFIQELGRIRIDIDNPKEVNLYIPKLYKNTFEDKLHFIETKEKQIELFKNDINAFKRKYNNSTKEVADDIFYLNTKTEWCINKIGRTRLLLDKLNVNYIINKFGNKEKKYDEWAFIRIQLEWMGLEEKFSSIVLIEQVVDVEEKEELQSYLNRLVGKRLYKEEQKELNDKILFELVSIDTKVDYRTKMMKVTSMERIIREDLNLNYAITSKVEDKKIKGERIRKPYILINKIN